MGKWNGEALGYVIAVSFTVLFIPLTVDFMILMPWLDPITTESAMILFAYNACVALLIANYLLVMFKDPGSVDLAYVPGGLGHFGEIDARRSSKAKPLHLASAPTAMSSNLQEPITADNAKNASSEWIITVLGSTTA
ncbi:hypothetical protein HDU97_008393 [Phlyctochytrium planicorne]|nr:hypothetical protein HDU97_008393 [Phlyctochytrium planicorne]